MDKLSAIVLSFLASFCFFITFLLNKEIINFILSCVWLCIGIANFNQWKKRK